MQQDSERFVPAFVGLLVVATATYGQGVGSVYIPNSVDDPIVRPVTLTGLDGTGYLRSGVIDVTNAVGHIAPRAYSGTLEFTFDPDTIGAERIHFSETMAYYYGSSLNSHLVALGFAGLTERVSVVVFNGTFFGHTWMPLASAYDPGTRTISLGSDLFGFDTEAMDGDLILHEFSHAIQHAVRPSTAGVQVLMTETDQAVALLDGHADYVAASYSGDAEIGEYIAGVIWRRAMFDRSADNFYTLTDYPWNAGHRQVSMVLSGALWDLRASVGVTVTDTLAVSMIQTVEDNDLGTPELNASLDEALDAILLADTSRYGGIHHEEIRQAFAIHGIGEYDFSTPFPMVHNPGNNYDDENSMPSWTVNGAAELAITFDKFVTKLDDAWFTSDMAPEAGDGEKSTVDYLEILDGDGTVIGTYTGRELQGQPVVVPGDTVQFHLVTDSDRESFGYRVVDISGVFEPYTVADYAVLLETFGSTTDLRADFNEDGIVDVVDFAILRANYEADAVLAGDPPSDPVPTPEPTTLGMLVLGGLAILRRQRLARKK